MKAESRTSGKAKNPQGTAGVTEDSADSVKDLTGIKGLIKTPKQAAQLERESNQNPYLPSGHAFKMKTSQVSRDCLGP